MARTAIPKSLSVEDVLKEMFWLAWQACGGPMGMGAFQDRPGATKDQVWQNVTSSGDYGGMIPQRDGSAYGDYVFGRMMKLNVEYGADWIEVADNPPRTDYQAWCRTYPTYQSLVDAALANVAEPVEAK